MVAPPPPQNWSCKSCWISLGEPTLWHFGGTGAKRESETRDFPFTNPSFSSYICHKKKKTLSRGVSMLGGGSCFTLGFCFSVLFFNEMAPWKIQSLNELLSFYKNEQFQSIALEIQWCGSRISLSGKIQFQTAGSKRVLRDTAQCLQRTSTFFLRVLWRCIWSSTSKSSCTAPRIN